MAREDTTPPPRRATTGDPERERPERLDRRWRVTYLARMANVPTGDLSFRSATATRRIEPGLHALEVPDGWSQGRGAFGGLVLGALLRAACDEERDPARRPRALAGDICGPVLTGPAEIRARVLRRGKNQTNCAVELVQGGVVQALMSTVLSAPRAVSAPAITGSAPIGKPWRDIEPLPIQAPLGPVFAIHYEYRLDGPMPFSSAPEAVAEGWVREKAQHDRLDAPAIIGLLDAWYPAIFTMSDAPRPIATVSFAAQIFVDPAELEPTEPLRYRARAVASDGGLFLELRELWSGKWLVAANQQTFAILK